MILRVLGSKCDDTWFEMEDSCFRVFAGTIYKVWDKAREHCLQQDGDLAIVDSEMKRQTVASHLNDIDDRHPDINIAAFIGIRKFGTWQWLGGRNISSSVWHSGYPHALKSGKCAALARGPIDWKLLQSSCRYTIGFICETSERKYLLMM